MHTSSQKPMRPPVKPKITRTTTLVVLALFLSAISAAIATPKLQNNAPRNSLASVVPTAFGSWHYIPSSTIQPELTLTPGETNQDQPYDDILSRTYSAIDGSRVMLTLAFGARQRQEVKIHRPELCYPAQGLPVLFLKKTSFPITSTTGTPITGNRMIAKSATGTVELVSYWIRIGTTYSDSPWITRLTIVKEGLAGKMTDGILVRASQRVPTGSDYAAAFQKQEQFLADLVAASPANARYLIAR